jgi:hypothetical protein
VTETLEPVVLASGEKLECVVRYYDYGVTSLNLELRFETDWPGLVAMAGKLVPSQDVERLALETLRLRLGQVRDSLVKPYSDWPSEDYYVAHIEPAEGCTAEALMQGRATEIAEIVRGEVTPLAEEEIAEILHSHVSYYPEDLLVVGWMAAFVYDTPDGAATTLQLLEYANSQLLEFRHYDGVLTRELAEVYQALDQGTTIPGRWKLARRAARLNTIRLDVMELAERVDNSLKFLSDMFAARMYRLIAAKIGVPDYRRLVDAKLDTAGELYRFMMDEFHQGRAFVLELMIVIILIIDLIFLFKGKS